MLLHFNAISFLTLNPFSNWAVAIMSNMPLLNRQLNIQLQVTLSEGFRFTSKKTC